MSGSNHRIAVAVAVAVVVGTVILLIATEGIPYHIDELRQVESYERTYSDIVDMSFGQQQPPLNSLLGASAQRILGVGDWQQRWCRCLPASEA